jgi:hypothetical protein
MHTQSVLAKLTEININISMSERLSTTYEDMLGLAPTYGLVILIALTIAFSIAGLISKKLTVSARLLYPLAGGVAFLVMLLAMQPILNVTLLAGARGTAGIALQVCAGVIAGICFAHLLKNSAGSVSQQKAST